MSDVEDFLRAAWSATEREIAANDKEQRDKEIAKQIAVLKHAISLEEDEIARGWGQVGLSVAIVAGSFLFLSFSPRIPPVICCALFGVVFCFGVPIFRVVALVGVVAVFGMALMKLIIIPMKARFARLKSELASLQGGD